MTELSLAELANKYNIDPADPAVLERLLRSVDYWRDNDDWVLSRYVDSEVGKVYEDGMTPLMLAANGGLWCCAPHLMIEGADVNECSRGMYAVDFVDDCGEPTRRHAIMCSMFGSGLRLDTIKGNTHDVYRHALWYVLFVVRDDNYFFFRFARRTRLDQFFDDAPWTPFEQMCRLMSLARYQTQVDVERFMYLLPDHVTYKWRGGTALHLLMRAYPWAEERAFMLPLVHALLTRCTQADVRMRDVHGRVMYDVAANDPEIRAWMDATPRLLISNHRRNRERRYRKKLLSEWRRERLEETYYKYFLDNGSEEDVWASVYSGGL